MSFLSDSTTLLAMVVIGAGQPVTATSAVKSPVCVKVQWDEDAGTDAEWAAVANGAPSSDDIREIAKYLLETGQAAT